MAVFSTTEMIDRRLDWTVLRDGGVALYWRSEILADDLHWFGSNGYRIVSFETADWHTEDQMHDSLKADLSFPDYYGKNLDALDECLWDDLLVPDAGGLVLVLNHYDHFAKANLDAGSSGKKTVDVVLDMFARAIQYHMLFGRRLIILVQSGRPARCSSMKPATYYLFDSSDAIDDCKWSRCLRKCPNARAQQGPRTRMNKGRCASRITLRRYLTTGSGRLTAQPEVAPKKVTTGMVRRLSPCKV